MTMINSFDGGKAGELAPELREMIARRARLLGSAYRLFYKEPLHIVRGSGVWLYDSHGKAYLDVYNNVAVVGHSHPEVVSALSAQAGVLNTHTRYLHDTVLDYAQRLLAKFPEPLNRAMFTCTGSEANDLALRIAKFHTRATGFIVTSLAYHGGTEAVAALSPSLGLGTASHVRTVPPPDVYRNGAANVGHDFARAVKSAIADLADHGHPIAALVADTVFASDGIHTHPAGSLAAAVDAVRSAGGLFIADEVQPGFGRTGEEFWGFQRHAVVPDLVSLGKPMGNGHPIAGLVMRADVAAEFGAASRYFNTFGGNPVSASVALTVLDIIERERLQANAASVGAHLKLGLQELAKRHPWIGDVRGAGLFLGVELVTDRENKTPASAVTDTVVNQLRQQGVLISACGPAANVLKIRPPLVFERAHAEQFLDTLDGALKRL